MQPISQESLPVLVEPVQSKEDGKVRYLARKALKAEIERLLHPEAAYKPFTWIQPEIETKITKKGKVKTKLKKPGYWKLTNEEGSVIELDSGTKLGPRRYQVQKTGALKRLDMETSRADRRQKKNQGQTLTHKKG